jgi:secreted trypsin-like serine protease
VRSTPLIDDINNININLATTRLTALGWGVIEAGWDGTTVSDVLQEATDLEYIPFEECRSIKKGGESYGDLTEDMMCTFADGQDLCFGDSGGPVLWREPVGDGNGNGNGGTWYQVGIMSL